MLLQTRQQTYTKLKALLIVGGRAAVLFPPIDLPATLFLPTNDSAIPHLYCCSGRFIEMSRCSKFGLEWIYNARGDNTCNVYTILRPAGREELRFIISSYPLLRKMDRSLLQFVCTAQLALDFSGWCICVVHFQRHWDRVVRKYRKHSWHSACVYRWKAF